MALFTHEDFIILGMLFAKYFRAYIYNPRNGHFGGGSWSGGGGGYDPFGQKRFATGRGGIITNEAVGDGDDGRPNANDSKTGNTKVSLAGARGTITGPGFGNHPGQFGRGGPANDTSTGRAASAGGGSGWFGGGSSVVLAGGGGGSNFCYTVNNHSASAIRAAESYTGKSYNPPIWIQPGLWIGVDTPTLTHYVKNIYMYQTNTRHIQEYDTFKSALGNCFDAFIHLHELANGDGLCLISKPNTMIEFNFVTGTIDNILEIVQYTGTCKEFIPPTPGRYHFILWGAQGGTSVYTPSWMNPPEGQPWTGGFGGAVGGIFDLQVQPLYIYVGQEGQSVLHRDSFNGGGNADGNNTGGGGATDIRWTGLDGSGNWNTGLDTRFLVAGGGGGCTGITGGGADEPFENGSSEGVQDPSQPDPGVIEFPSESEKDLWFLVNDLSIAYVTLSYYTLAELPDNYRIQCTLYIDGGNEGIMTQAFKLNPISGTIELAYYLDQVYPENTETHWVRLSVTIETDVFIIFPENGVNIRVETRARPNESDDNWNKNHPIYQLGMERVKVLDNYLVKLKQAGSTIPISQVESIDGLHDFVKIVFKAVKNMNISTIEKLRYSDETRVIEKIKPIPEDIHLDEIETSKIIDVYSAILKEDIQPESLGVSKLEEIKLVDLYNIVLKQDLPPGDFNIKKLETLTLQDVFKATIKGMQPLPIDPGIQSINNLNDMYKIGLKHVSNLRIQNIETLTTSDFGGARHE